MNRCFIFVWKILFWASAVARTMTDVELEQSKKEIGEAIPNPSFTWTSPFALHVEFPDGQEDDIGLQPVHMAGKPVKCLFRGKFYQDSSASAVISGCIEDDTVTITIISKDLWGRTAFEVNKGLVEELENPYANNLDVELDEDEADRDKRSIYEDYEDYDYLEVQYDSSQDIVTVPPLLTTNVKLAFDRSLKENLGTEEAAKDYVRAVAEHGSLYLQNFSPEIKIFLNFEEEIEFINEIIKPDRTGLKTAFTKKNNEPIPLVIVVSTDDSNNHMGVSPPAPGKACNTKMGVSIVKKRSKKNIAGITLAHELGHIHGMMHDHDEDKQYKHTGDAACHGKGLMSAVKPELLPEKRPPTFSTCSVTRFSKWFRNKYGTCMQRGIVDNESKINYLDATCKSLTASPGDFLQSGCQKPEELKDGAWLCSGDGATCYPTCNPGFKVLNSNKNPFVECYGRNWTENPNTFLCQADSQYKPPVSYRVSSLGEAGETLSSRMGDYFPTGDNVNQFPIYRKGTNFLYVNTQGVWIIGPKVGAISGWIHHPEVNPTPSTPPVTGWKFVKDGTYHDDSSLTVKPFSKKYKSIVSYRVSSTGEAGEVVSSYMGDYFPTGDNINQFPIFRKGQHFLYVDITGSWWIGDKVGANTGWINHPETNPTPSTPPVTGWKFAKDGIWHDDISLTVVPFFQ